MRGFSVGLITEGYNPDNVGGINTWVQQLIMAFPYVDFTMINITSKNKLSHTQFPSNVKKYLEIPLWSHKDEMTVYDRDDGLYEISINDSNCYNKELLSIKFYKHLENKYGSIYDIRKSFLDALKTIIITEFGEENIDVIHTSNAGLAGFVGVHLKQLLKKPLIVSEHGLHIREWKLRLSSKFFPSEIEFPEHIKQLNFRRTYKDALNINRDIVSFVYRNADNILPVTSTHIPTEISLGADPMKIQVINNGLTIPNEENNSCENNTENDCIKIATLARVNPIKNLELLIDVARILVEESNKYEFHIAGPIEDYDYFKELISRIEQYNLENKVIFHGIIYDRNWLQDKDLMLLTSLSEGQPYAVIEALLQDLPVVSTSVGDIPNMVNNRECVVEGFSADKLASRVKHVFVARKKIRYGDKYKFSMDRFRKNMENIYKSWL